MYKRLLSFITASNILANNQYGFSENHSIYIALLNLVDQITNELDNKQFSLGIFIDLSKAFDALDHEILISKLNHYNQPTNGFTAILKNVSNLLLLIVFHLTKKLLSVVSFKVHFRSPVVYFIC